jgi:hypothetical protein
MTWGAKLFLLSISIVLGGALALLANTAMAETNTISSTVTGTTTVDKTPPTASAPSIVINNQDVCTSASSVAVQTQILGFATGQTVTDENCERLKLARSLYGMGMKVAAVSVLCQDKRVWDGMWMAGTPCPYLGKIGKAATEAWEKSEYKPPTLITTQRKNSDYLKPEEPQEDIDAKSKDKSGLAIFGGIIALLLLL